MFRTPKFEDVIDHMDRDLHLGSKELPWLPWMAPAP